MYDHIAIIEQEPAFFCLSLNTAFFLVVLFGCFQYTFRECVQHSVAGAVAENEIVGERCNVFDVQKEDVFALSVLQGFNDFMCQFKCVQISPHYYVLAAKQSPIQVEIATLG